MAINYGEDYVYAREKLLSSFLVMGESIIHIQNIEDDGEVFFVDIENNKQAVCHLSEINTEPPRLGYVNQGRVSRFITRLPARHYRQGFREQTLREFRTYKGQAARFRINYSFALAHRGIYPDVETAVERIVNGEDNSLAFCRQFDIFKKKTNLYLGYKGFEVGKVNEENANLNLHSQFIFLNEVLEQCR